LWDALYLLITKLRTVDKTLIVYPWEESDLSDKVLTNANIPKTVVEIKQFFSRAIPHSKGGILYILAYLGHNKEMSAIMEEIGYWLKEQSSGLWMRQIQTDRTHLVGWALYSTNQMNELLLGAAIEAKTGVAVSICSHDLNRTARSNPGEQSSQGSSSQSGVERLKQICFSTPVSLQVEQLKRFAVGNQASYRSGNEPADQHNHPR
jgi:hypothetical protein